MLLRVFLSFDRANDSFDRRRCLREPVRPFGHAYIHKKKRCQSRRCERIARTRKMSTDTLNCTRRRKGEKEECRSRNYFLNMLLHPARRTRHRDPEVLVESCHVSSVVAKRDTRTFPARISAHFILASAHGARQLKERTFEAIRKQNANHASTKRTGN